jgi:hypothetical protein
MAKRRKKPAADAAPGATVQDKIAGCLALIATRGMETADAALKLDAIGFDAGEISALLDVGSNYVNVERHRKATGAKKKRLKSG